MYNVLSLLLNWLKRNCKERSSQSSFRYYTSTKFHRQRSKTMQPQSSQLIFFFNEDILGLKKQLSCFSKTVMFWQQKIKYGQDQEWPTVQKYNSNPILVNVVSAFLFISIRQLQEDQSCAWLYFSSYNKCVQTEKICMEILQSSQIMPQGTSWHFTFLLLGKLKLL